MIKYIIKRLIFGFFVIYGAVTIIFFIFHALPGNKGLQHLPKNVSKEDIAHLEKIYGLDKSIGEQYFMYLSDLSPISVLDLSPSNQKEYAYTKLFSTGKNTALVLKAPYLRRSRTDGEKVSEKIKTRFWDTFWLAITAIFFSSVIGIVIGLYAALHHNKFSDHILVISSVIGLSMPSFVAGSLLGLILAVTLKDVTGLELTGALVETNLNPNTGEIESTIELKNLILPALTLGIRPLAVIVQLTRSSMLEVLSQDFIRTAKAKGLSNSKIILRHALPNALNPVITAISGWLAWLMAGTLFVEIIFGWNGLGHMIYQAVVSSDFPLVMGSVIIVSIIFIFVNILVDILHAITDPRVRLR